MTFHIGQDVRVYPRTWCLRRYNGWRGQIDTFEVEDDEAGNPQHVYRVKLLDEPGQGFPYYAHELKALDYDDDRQCEPVPDAAVRSG